ncbi:MAG: peptidoglycan-associated lipoprotein Pal [Deltaproteobacteria bacterium]|nr:peptidoglycan-associated lipoprotein Pal [Deltaproteobacteria bacterium]
MIYRISLSFLGFFFSTSIALIGCSSQATTKSETPATRSTSAAAKDALTKGRASGGKVQTAATPKSSLEAKRRGESTATAASSPLKEVYFDYDRYDLTAGARATLKANADWLKANPSVRVEIEGHCDERGTNEYNLALGAKRAQAAKDYLVTLGISANRLSTKSFGEELPACREQTEGCWQKNRRDKFAVIPAKPGV